MNPSIPTSSHSCCVRKFYSHNWLFCLSLKARKFISTLTDKNMFTFISGKHSQQDARKWADRLNSERKFWKTLASKLTGKILLWPRSFDHYYHVPGVGHLMRKNDFSSNPRPMPGLSLLQLKNERWIISHPPVYSVKFNLLHIYLHLIWKLTSIKLNSIKFCPLTCNEQFYNCQIWDNCSKKA